jgi:hypothetical protein
MDTFHSRVRQNTIDRTFFTLDTDVGIKLPDHLFGRGLAEKNPGQSSGRKTCDSVEAFPDEITSV